MWRRVRTWLARYPVSALMMALIAVVSVLLSVLTHSETIGIQVWFASILLWAVYLFIAEILQTAEDSRDL